MKKLLALLLAAMMLFSLTACDLNNLMTQLEEVADNFESLQSGVNSEIDENDETPDTSQTDNQGDTETKVDESKTMDLFREIFSGPYTLKVETYVKDFQNPDNKTVSSTTLTVVDGDKSYTEYTSATNPNTVVTQLYIGEYRYVVYDEYKMISRSPIRKSDQGVVMVMKEEEFYADMIGEAGTREIFGKTYRTERFSAFAETVTYCYEGEELKYIIGDSGGVDIIMGVLELKKGADSSYFELPEDYEKNY